MIIWLESLFDTKDLPSFQNFGSLQEIAFSVSQLEVVG